MIKSIEVYELFGYHNHNIKLESISERVVILHGPNGSGKTTIFRMLDSICKKNLRIFIEVPFSSFKIKMETDTLIISKLDDSVKFSMQDNPNKEFEIENSIYKKDRIVFSEVNLIIESLGGVRVGARRYRYEGKTYELHEICELLEIDTYSNRIELPQWLLEFINNINVLYIGSERLISNGTRKVKAYGQKLIDIISQFESRYAFVSKDLDSTFPKRIIMKSKTKEDIGNELIIDQLGELAEKRSEITKRGILSEKSNEQQFIPVGEINIEDIKGNSLLKQFLALYNKDTFEKFSVFDELIRKINIFELLINDFFNGKKIVIDREKGYRVISTIGKYRGKPIPPTKLSSGEQHFLVLFFELVFNTKRNQLVLIDEPEISLHVSWQITMVDRLIEITELNNNSFLLATHSPSILRNHRNLVIPTGYDEDEE